jgi:IclR family transcriptional regulator, KDG regulon repressor
MMRPSATLRKRKARGAVPAASGSSKSLQKALRILLFLGQSGSDLGITQLANSLGLDKATVHRLLNAMQKFDLIEKNSENGRYRLGLKLHELGVRALESRTLRNEAHRFLLDLARESHETVSLAVSGNGGIICLDRVDSPHTVISVRTPVGARFPAHCTAVAKALLAYLPDEEIDAILASHRLARFTPFTLTRAEDVKTNLRLTVQRGYALDAQELEEGLSGVAAPIRGRDGQVIAAVGMAGPTPRFRGGALTEKIVLTKAASAKISAGIGYRPAV